MAVCVVVAAPLSLLDFRIDASVWPYLLVSTILETAYVLLLARAYEVGSMSVVYPVARGSAPVVALVVTIVITASLPSLGVAVGIGVIVAGILAVRGLGGHADRRDVWTGGAIGCLIGAYGVTDAAGLRHAAPLPYLFLDMIVPAVVGLGLVVRRSGARRVRAAVDGAALLAGVATTAAFGLSLAASPAFRRASSRRCRRCARQVSWWVWRWLPPSSGSQWGGSERPAPRSSWPAWSWSR